MRPESVRATWSAFVGLMLPLALALGVVLLVVALALNAFIGLVRRWRLARDDVAGVVHGARGVAS